MHKTRGIDMAARHRHKVFAKPGETLQKIWRRPAEVEQSALVNRSATRGSYARDMIRKLNLLHRLHTRLLEILATATPLITPSIEDADLIGLEYLRDELVQMMGSYASFVSVHLVRKAEKSHDNELLCRARAIKVGSDVLLQSYDKFCLRWMHRDPMLNWPEYRLSAMAMMTSVRAQVALSSDWLLTMNARAQDVAAGEAVRNRA